MYLYFRSESFLRNQRSTDFFLLYVDLTMNFFFFSFLIQEDTTAIKKDMKYLGEQIYLFRLVEYHLTEIFGYILAEALTFHVSLMYTFTKETIML